MKKSLLLFMILMSVSALNARGRKEPFHTTVDHVDMDRFSGDWYVVALIPTVFEKGARNGIENYRVDEKGQIRVRYTYEKKGKEKVMYQKGWIIDKESNAEWRVRPLWPLKLPYYIIDLDEDYAYTMIATNNFRYLWIMTRTPTVDKALLNRLIEKAVEKGFNRDDIILMEQG